MEIILLNQDPITLRGLAHGDEIIEQFIKEEPKPKSAPAHKLWKKNYNRVVDAINKVAGTNRHNHKK